MKVSGADSLPTAEGRFRDAINNSLNIWMWQFSEASK